MSTSTTVRGLNGETFTLHHATGASLAELKQLIAEHTGIDPALQHVSCGGRTLIDDNEDDAQGCSGEARFRAEDELAALLEQRYNRASSIGAVATGQRTVSSSRPRSRPCGLQNIGGTSCYLNATLQALLTVEQLALPDFYTCFLNGPCRSAMAAGSLTAIGDGDWLEPLQHLSPRFSRVSRLPAQVRRLRQQSPRKGSRA